MRSRHSLRIVLVLVFMAGKAEEQAGKMRQLLQVFAGY